MRARHGLLILLGLGCQAQRQAGPSLSPPPWKSTGLTSFAPGDQALIVENGQERWITAVQAEQQGYTLVDLSDDFTPVLFADHQGQRNAYRSTFVGLANDRLDSDGQPLASGSENYLELYGIFPAFSVLSRRFASQAGRQLRRRRRPGRLGGEAHQPQGQRGDLAGAGPAARLRGPAGRLLGPQAGPLRPTAAAGPAPVPAQAHDRTRGRTCGTTPGRRWGGTCWRTTTAPCCAPCASGWWRPPASSRTARARSPPWAPPPTWPTTTPPWPPGPWGSTPPRAPRPSCAAARPAASGGCWPRSSSRRGRPTTTRPCSSSW